MATNTEPKWWTDIQGFSSTIPSQYVYANAGGVIIDGDKPFMRLSPITGVTVNMSKGPYSDKTCAYCGNVNAPDARKCCGCQHAI